jgi:3-dehydroquinate dehydratase type I
MLSTVPTADDTQLDVGDWTHFLSLSFRDMKEHVHVLSSVCEGCDAVEFRADLLASYSPDFIHKQMALLRAHVPIPVIYTVRTRSQAGTYPDEDLEQRLQLLEGMLHTYLYLKFIVLVLEHCRGTASGG